MLEFSRQTPLSFHGSEAITRLEFFCSVITEMTVASLPLWVFTSAGVWASSIYSDPSLPQCPMAPIPQAQVLKKYPTP